jgi:replication factor C subunit 2/4
MIKHCQKAEIDEALARVDGLWEQGYSAVDIVTTIFRVVKGMEDLPEYTKLEFIRVSVGWDWDWRIAMRDSRGGEIVMTVGC